MVEPEKEDAEGPPRSPQLQQLNKNLLSLGKLRNSTRSNAASSVSVEFIKEVANTSCNKTENKEDADLPPPPSYESVVRINVKEKEDSVSLPSTSQLPRYRDVAGLSDAPPTYHSLFSDKVFRAISLFTADEDSSDEATDTCESIVRGRCKFATVCFNFLLFIFIITFVLLLPVGMITIGIIFVHKCPVQPRIPIYLIVLGFFQMLECCGRLGYKIFQNGQERNTWRERYRRKDPLVYFVIVWFVIGSMWVYQTDPACKDCTDPITPFINATHSNISSPTNFPSTFTTTQAKSTKSESAVVYCDPIIYNFAFWIITTYYSVIGFFCLMLIIDVVLRTINRCCCAQR